MEREQRKNPDAWLHNRRNDLKVDGCSVYHRLADSICVKSESELL
jgi:hypothetical protein